MSGSILIRQAKILRTTRTAPLMTWELPSTRPTAQRHAAAEECELSARADDLWQENKAASRETTERDAGEESKLPIGRGFSKRGRATNTPERGEMADDQRFANPADVHLEIRGPW